jgi:hypothetical protein
MGLLQLHLACGFRTNSRQDGYLTLVLNVGRCSKTVQVTLALKRLLR